MAKQPQRELLTPTDRLAIRISNMINSPQAQHRRSALIHRLDTDPEEAWDEVIGLIAEVSELDLTFNDDGTVTVKWERSALQDRDDFILKEDSKVETEVAAPF